MINGVYVFRTEEQALAVWRFIDRTFQAVMGQVRERVLHHRAAAQRAAHRTGTQPAAYAAAAKKALSPAFVARAGAFFEVDHNGDYFHDPDTLVQGDWRIQRDGMMDPHTKLVFELSREDELEEYVNRVDGSNVLAGAYGTGIFINAPNYGSVEEDFREFPILGLVLANIVANAEFDGIYSGGAVMASTEDKTELWSPVGQLGARIRRHKAKATNSLALQLAA